MKQNDVIQRFLFEDLSIRGEWVQLTESYQQIIQQHQYPLPLKYLVGQMLVISALLTATLKFQGSLTVQFQGKGGLKLLLAQCNDQFQLRGLAEWLPSLNWDRLETEFFEGVMVITIEPALGSRYQGMVKWEGNSLADSIEGYFRQSEQLPTRLWLAINDNVASGFLLQAMPSAGLQANSSNPDWDHVLILSNTITENELLTLNAEKILHRLYPEENIRLFEPVDVIFQCRCSRERSENALKIAGEKEIRNELRLKNIIDVTCEFCNKTYHFNREDIDRIFFADNEPPQTLH